MGFSAGYGTAMCSYVQMAILCYTGQTVINRVKAKYFILSYQYSPHLIDWWRSITKISFLFNRRIWNKWQNERLLSALYDFKWYNSPRKLQKDILQMIHLTQNGKGPTIGPFEPLDLFILKNVRNKLHSFVLISHQFIQIYFNFSWPEKCTLLWWLYQIWIFKHCET